MPNSALCLVACFAVTLGCGTLYTYSAYSPQLSDRLTLSASTVNAIGMVGNFSMSLSGPFAGYIVDTFGFTYPIIISGFATSMGYAILYFAYERVWHSVSLLAGALLLLGIGATFAFSAAVKCAAVSFPQIRGTATAVTMSGYGLSAFAMSLIAQLTAETQSGSGGAQHTLAVLGIVPTALLIVFGQIVIRSRPRKHNRTMSEEYNLGAAPPDNLVDRIAERKQQESEHQGFALFKSKTFWLYFSMLGLMAGMGQAYIYTCGYIAKALVAEVLDPAKPLTQDLVAPIQTHQVAILSLSNCCGRLISGSLSDALKNNFKLSRTYSLFLSVSLCMAAMVTSSQVSNVDMLWLPTALSGLFYGTVFGAYPGIISDDFGVKRFSFNWGLVALAPIPFSSWLAIRIGKLYDANSESAGMCRGPRCFQGAYKLHIALSGVVFVLLVLALRVQKTSRS